MSERLLVKIIDGTTHYISTTPIDIVILDDDLDNTWDTDEETITIKDATRFTNRYWLSIDKTQVEIDYVNNIFAQVAAKDA